MTQSKIINNIEVNGETVLSVVDGMGIFKNRALDILSKHGISQPEPGKWYPAHVWLDSFKTISEMIGTATLFLIGKKIPENAQFPPDIDDIEKALQAIDVAYHMNHRINGLEMFNPKTGKMTEGIGHYKFEKAGDKKARMICDKVPYPCDFDKGIIEAMAKRFKPAGSPFAKVVHDDSVPCRKKGADSCTYYVEW